MISDMIFNVLVRDGKGYDKLDKMQKIEVQMFTFIMGIINEQFKWEGLPPEIKPYNWRKFLTSMVRVSCSNTKAAIMSLLMQ